MSMSLREQLLAAGLGSKQQAKNARDHQHQQQRQPRPKGAPTPSATPAADLAHAEKLARDRELNRRQQAKAEARALLGQIRQWADQDKLPPVQSDEAFSFVDEGKVRRVRVDAERRGQIQRGEVVIIRVGDRYEQLRATAAERIRQRDASVVIDLGPTHAAPAEAAPQGEDPYKDFVVPDDLVW